MSNKNVNQSSIDQAVSLAGLAQSIRIVQHIAWKGQTNNTDFKAIITSLLKVDASSAIDVYGGSFEVSTGLRVLRQQLDTTSNEKDPEFVGLVINLITLHKQLSSNTQLMDKLSQYIAQLSKKYSKENYFQDEELFQQIISDCSDVYQNTLSKLENRIQVKGEPKYLKIDDNQKKVRAALLCAVRSIFLWRQSGGSRWQFLFKKKGILDSVGYLLNNPLKD
jgi:high frequency lysogenization protein